MLRFLTTVSLCAISFNSYAADLSARPTAPATPQTYNWTGLYAGAQLGYADGNTANAYSFLMINPPHTRQPWYVDGVNNYGGITGGGHVGYLYQGNSNFVLGVEADYSAANITGDDKGAMGGVNTRKIDQLGTVKGRFGVGFDRTLIYMTAGYAYGHVEAGDTRLPETDSMWLSGWTLGGGYEYALTDHWRVRGQYQYVDFGSATFTHRPSAIWSYEHRSERLSFHNFQVGVSYRF